MEPIQPAPPGGRITSNPMQSQPFEWNEREQELQNLVAIANGYTTHGLSILLLDESGEPIQTLDDYSRIEHAGIFKNVDQRIRVTPNVEAIGVFTKHLCLVIGPGHDGGVTQFPASAFLRPVEDDGSIVRLFTAPIAMFGARPRKAKYRAWSVVYGLPFLKANDYSLFVPFASPTTYQTAPQPLIDALIASQDYL